MAEKEYQELKDKLDYIESLVLRESLSRKEVLSLEECVTYTGFSKGHLYRMTSTRAIPFYKPIGGKIFFHRSEIDLWLLNNRQATTDEIESKAASYCVTHKN